MAPGAPPDSNPQHREPDPLALVGHQRLNDSQAVMETDLYLGRQVLRDEMPGPVGVVAGLPPVPLRSSFYIILFPQEVGTASLTSFSSIRTLELSAAETFLKKIPRVVERLLPWL